MKSAPNIIITVDGSAEWGSNVFFKCLDLPGVGVNLLFCSFSWATINNDFKLISQTTIWDNEILKECKAVPKAEEYLLIWQASQFHVYSNSLHTTSKKSESLQFFFLFFWTKLNHLPFFIELNKLRLSLYFVDPSRMKKKSVAAEIMPNQAELNLSEKYNKASFFFQVSLRRAKFKYLNILNGGKKSSRKTYEWRGRRRSKRGKHNGGYLRIPQKRLWDIF